ncbi:MAG: RluA family pseudouridine synthase, partial [Myxococcaceae bacterium]
MIFFELQPEPDELPARLANPFAEGEPHPLALRAAEDLRARLHRGELAGGIDLLALERPGRGKMFGVLVVAVRDGRVGYLSAFSGMLGERWHVDGFAPPLFDSAARDAFWPAGEAELRELDRCHAELTDGVEITALRARLSELTARHEVETAELRARLDANRRDRQDRRRLLADSALPEDEGAAARRTLDQLSRADDSERRRMELAHREEREQTVAALRALDARRAELEQHRAERSRQLWRQIAENYVIPNARDQVRTVGQLYAPTPPPGGAGDCAAPKLLALAFRQGLRPLALAEFWMGAPPLTGGRIAGTFYPACRRKCGVVLPFMLEGLEVEPDPGEGAIRGPRDELRIVYEDEWLIVV